MATPVDPEIVTEPPASVSVPTIKFDPAATIRSPFFWMIVGLAFGVWLCKSKKL